MDEKGEVLLDVKDMYKNFGVTVALNHVSFSVRRGEIRGLIGENGSGKSTASSIIAGIQPAVSGEMFYKGKKWNPASPLVAGEQGVSMIVQEAGTIPNISVAENIFLGRYEPFKKGLFINRAAMAAEAQKALNAIGAGAIKATIPTRLLDMQERKLVEIAKCIHTNPDLLIVDETTTSLSQTGRDLLYHIIHKMADDNKAVLIISHDIAELIEHCDMLTILRDGQVVDNLERQNFSDAKIKSLMVGRELSGHFYRSDKDGYSQEVVLKADCITTMQDLMCFSLDVHKGEILGVGGLSHCGMHTLGRALCGLEEVVDGEVVLTHSKTRIKNARTAVKHKMGYISKNRDTESLELNASIRANISSTGYHQNRAFGPIISFKKEKQYVEKQVESLQIKCVDQYQITSNLSGGNKQKVVFGKWIACDADILVMDCPTRGVDVGVKAAMYQLIYEMKKMGKSIIMISEELPELMGMSDRLVIMKDGNITGEFLRTDGYDDKILINYMI